MRVRLTGSRDDVSRALRLLRTVLPVEDVTGYTTTRWSYPDVHLDVRVALPIEPTPERASEGVTADEDP